MYACGYPNGYGESTRPPQPNPTQPYYSPSSNGYLKGRMVDRIEEVTPQEIPMDGTTVFFPVKDGMKVYAKFWNGNGLIETYVFERIDENHPEQPDVLSEVLKRISRIETELGIGGAT